MLVITGGLVRRLVLEESKKARIWVEDCEKRRNVVERLRGMECFPGGETQFVGNIYYRSLLPDEVIKPTQDVHRKLYNLSA